MKFVILLSLLGVISGSTVHQTALVYTNHPEVKYYSANGSPPVTGNVHSFQDSHGQYQFGYKLSDGQWKNEAKRTDGGVSGQYSYVDPLGQRVELTYVADKNGFRASGNHLPVAPPLPVELANAYNEAYHRLFKAHEEAKLRPKPEVVFVASPVPPQTTFFAAPAAPKPVFSFPKPEYSSSQYNANVGGPTFVQAPAPFPY